MKVLLFSVGTAIMPILMMFGFSIYIASDTAVPPTLPMSGAAGLLLGLLTTVGFLACIIGLHRSFMARQRERREGEQG